MKKTLFLLLSIMLLVGCSKVEKSTEVTVKECAISEKKESLKIVIEHITPKQYDVVYTAYLFLDEDENVDKNLSTAVDVEIVKNHTVVGTDNSWGDSHVQTFTSFDKDDRFTLIGNIAYENGSEKYNEEDIIEMKLQKSDGKYKVDIVDFTTLE
ncbi:hypothetical protein [Amedibacillus sp. YH-ame10]